MAKLKNYDPARATSRDLFQYAAFVFNNDEIGERTVLIPPWKLDGKAPDEISAQVQHSYEVFKRAEEYAEAQNYTYTNEEAIKRANDFYSGVHLMVAANCYSVYSERLEEDTDGGRAEQAYLDNLNEKIDLDEHLPDAIEKSAEIICEQWIAKNGPEHARGLVHGFEFHLVKNLAAAAIFEADSQVPPDAPDEAWREAFETLYKKRVETDTEDIYSNYLMHEAQYVLENDLKPVEMSFEELRIWAGIIRLEGMAEHGESSQLPPPIRRKLTDTMHLLKNRYKLSSLQPDEPKDGAGTARRLTSAQMNLMIYILLSNYDDSARERPSIWSPKAFLRRSPTKAEAATLSRRVSALAERGLIDKSGRKVSVTDHGRALIGAYAAEHEHDESLLKVRLVLDLNETWKNLEALKLVSDVARKHGRRGPANRGGKSFLNDLFNAETKRRDDLVQQLRANGTTTSIDA